MAAIRPLRSSDCDVLYDICLKTGAAGGDATALYRDPSLIGHIYAGPYAALALQSCLVVEDDLGVGGYIAGTADTAAFEEACEAQWWPALRRQYRRPPLLDRSADASRIRHFYKPYRTAAALARSHPAHLHVNLLPRLQGQGWGTRLIDAWRDLVAAQGAAACHLLVGHKNPRAVGFYRAYGFEQLAASDSTITFGLATKTGGAS